MVNKINSHEEAREWLLNKITPTERHNRIGQAVTLGLAGGALGAGAGLGAGVGYIGGSQITKGIFNDRLQRARELGEKLISNRRNEIINNIGYFGDNYNSITVQDSTVDGKLYKNVFAKKILENNKPTDIKEAIGPNKNKGRQNIKKK